ncbi:methyl-accepting chemotaxis protein [Neobacillus sp. PS3-40]|uniref:methyl-accepting chemotaxis protein n=1 Tax=Neobacillus sp. PS3-40 TaxID=3070679 RepID=UPI0027E00528|nr:methyl-accepting chemotaxis protein [Neobacillus sp. PS3-40]WML46212.1 methyl-accepting chemotaxis protein [Neobacillus sp. PS3-40]
MKFTIRKKLIGGFLAVLLLLAGIVGIANFEISQMDQLYSQILDQDAHEVDMIQNYKAELFKQSNSVSAYLLTKDSTAVTNYQIAFSKFTKAYNEIESAEKDSKGMELLTKMRLSQNQFLQVVNKEIELKRQNMQDEYITLATTTAKDAGDRFQTAVDDVVKYKSQQMQDDRDLANKQMNGVKLIILIISALAIVISIVIVTLINFSISRPVVAVSNSLKQLASGNLTVPDLRVKNRDEIGVLASSLNGLSHHLKELIGMVYDSSVRVASSSEQLLASNEQNSRAAEQIAQSVQQTAAGSEKQMVHFEEVSSSVQEMATGILQISHSSESMKESTDKATHLAKNGSLSVQAVVSHMHDINISFEETSKIVSMLGSRSKEIDGIASLITDIAEQTNLLALNAAIEAARAGEHGKGFAVVADEVRKLAVQSKNSADKIANMIRFVQEETNQAIHAVENGNHIVDKGLSATKEANQAFSNISSSIEEVSSKVEDVSAAVEELTAQSTTIVQTIEFVKEIAEQGMLTTQESSASTQEQVATMEEVTASAHGLTKLADELQTAVSQFKL